VCAERSPSGSRGGRVDEGRRDVCSLVLSSVSDEKRSRNTQQSLLCSATLLWRAGGERGRSIDRVFSCCCFAGPRCSPRLSPPCCVGVTSFLQPLLDEFGLVVFFCPRRGIAPSKVPEAFYVGHCNQDRRVVGQASKRDRPAQEKAGGGACSCAAACFFLARHRSVGRSVGRSIGRTLRVAGTG